MIDIDQELEDALTNRFKYGNCKGLQATADDYLKGVYAMLYSDAPGKGVAEKDSWVKDQPDYLEAVDQKAERYANWEAARLKMQIIFAAVEKYRTDKATERNMMRASQ